MANKTLEHQRVMHSSHANHPSTSCAACPPGARPADTRIRPPSPGRRRGAARRPSRNGAPEGPGRRAARPVGKRWIFSVAALQRYLAGEWLPPVAHHDQQEETRPCRSTSARPARTGNTSCTPGGGPPVQGSTGTRDKAQAQEFHDRLKVDLWTRRGSARSRAIRGRGRALRRRTRGPRQPGNVEDSPALARPAPVRRRARRYRPQPRRRDRARGAAHGAHPARHRRDRPGRQRRHRASRDRRAEVGVECGGRMGMAGARAGHETREDRLETHPLADPGRSGTAARRTARASRRHGAFQSGDRPAPRQRDGAAVVASRPRAARRVDPPDQAKARKAITVPLSETAIAVLRRQHANPRAPECADSVFTYRGRPVYQTATAAWAKRCSVPA